MAVDPDRADVAALIDAFGASLHAQSVEMSMAMLADEPDICVIPSEGVGVHRGPEAVRTFLAHIYRGPRRYGWDLPNRSISIAGPIAWFVASGNETVEQDEVVRRIPYVLTGVAARTASGWRFRLLHPSEEARP
jgi:hypothetical protein